MSGDRVQIDLRCVAPLAQEQARIAEARRRSVLITQVRPVALSVRVSVGRMRPRSPDVG
jgi:hypothetical protein